MHLTGSVPGGTERVTSDGFVCCERGSYLVIFFEGPRPGKSSVEFPTVCKAGAVAAAGLGGIKRPPMCAPLARPS